MLRNKADSAGKHPWKTEVTEGDSDVEPSVITGWYSAVYEPAFSGSSARLTSISLLGVEALTPAFDPDTTGYTCGTGAAMTSINVTAESAEASVEATVNGEVVELETDVGLESNEDNTIKLTVTNGSKVKTYIIVIHVYQ